MDKRFLYVIASLLTFSVVFATFVYGFSTYLRLVEFDYKSKLLCIKEATDETAEKFKDEPHTEDSLVDYFVQQMKYCSDRYNSSWRLMSPWVSLKN